MAEITIYSTPTCGFCTLAKDYLREKGIEFNDIDVSTNQEEAQKMVEKTGQMGVPVIIINKDEEEHVIVGFDQAQLMQILEIE